MRYHAKQHSDGRWGIYTEYDLLATIGSQQECQAIIEALNHRQSIPQTLRQPNSPAENAEVLPSVASSLSWLNRTQTRNPQASEN